MNNCVNNLERFKNINFNTESVITEIANQQGDLLEKQLGELIKSYVDVKKYGVELSQSILDYKGYKLSFLVDGEITEYKVIHLESGKCDYFIKKDKGLEIDGLNVIVKTYISDIIRGID